MPDIRYPQTAREPLLETHFNQRIADPYRWLEGDPQNDPRVAEWISEQNRLTHSYLEGLPGRQVLRERMMQLLHDYDRLSPPVKRAGWYFFTRNKGVANQSSLYVRDSTNGQERVLIDPNSWSQDNYEALAEWQPSDDGRYLTYGVQVGGTDWRYLKVLNVETGEVLQDRVDWARYTTICWAPDHSGFFYARMPEPEANAPLATPIGLHMIYFHAIGTPQAADRLVHASEDNPRLLHGISRSNDGRYLFIYSSPGSNESTLSVIDLQQQAWTAHVLVNDFDAEWYVFDHHDSRFLATTTKGAPRKRIVAFDLSTSSSEPVEIIAETTDGSVISDVLLAGGKILVAYAVDAKTEIRVFNCEGRFDGIVQLPGLGTAKALDGRFDENEAFFIYTSYDTPATVYRYDVSANQCTPWLIKRPIPSSRYITEQKFYTSKDGTQVPMFIVKSADVIEAAPTLLYGYGGFGCSLLPAYDPVQLAWVEQGGVLAIANIRGGGEYGQSWHRAGQRENRQNVFDDFIAAGEFLKHTGITSPKGLVIQGDSGGGLLVAAVTNQRPDLVDVALPSVAVLDMLRYHRFTCGMLWIDEFGSPDEEQAFHTLLAYSPYHCIHEGSDYPAIMATTADADDRVVPSHTFKYVAALQAASIGSKPHLVRIETRAGHGADMPLEKVVAQYADMWAFAAHWTGLSVKP